MAYVGLTVSLLLTMLIFGYTLLVRLGTGLNSMLFVHKIARVVLFGFSTSSSGATLPLDLQTAIEDLGIHEEIASFVLPLGMTIKMDGTSIMQAIATLFIAGCTGYEITFSTLLMIVMLAIVTSIGTPAAPGAGAVILFAILSGVGFVNEMALSSSPSTGPSRCWSPPSTWPATLVVAKSENALDKARYEI